MTKNSQIFDLCFWMRYSGKQLPYGKSYLLCSYALRVGLPMYLKTNGAWMAEWACLLWFTVFFPFCTLSLDIWPKSHCTCQSTCFCRSSCWELTWGHLLPFPLKSWLLVSVFKALALVEETSKVLKCSKYPHCKWSVVLKLIFCLGMICHLTIRNTLRSRPGCRHTWLH